MSDEELEAVQRDLEAVRAQVQSLESQLTQELASVADLQTVVGDAEIQYAELQTQLVEDAVNVAALQDRIDQAEVREALMAAYPAWNRADTEGFRERFTERGQAGTILSLPESIGEPPIALRRVMDITVSGDTASIHSMYALGVQRNSVLGHLVKEDGVWKVDSEEQLAPKIREGTATIDIRPDDCSFAFDAEAIAGGNFAFSIENVGTHAHRMLLSRIADGVDLSEALQSEEKPGTEEAAFVHSLGPGEQTNVTFSEPLASGRYALLCFIPDLDDSQGLPHLARGTVAEFTVP